LLEVCVTVNCGIDSLRGEMIAVAAALAAGGLVRAQSGNISVRVDDGLLVTAARGSAARAHRTSSSLPTIPR
jgi:ribulose-5-phosphate 4-epimerase/fuculose-1-phosphate aldolase